MPEKTDLEKVAELLNVAILPPLDGKEAQSLHKALPGYQAVGLTMPPVLFRSTGRPST